jgi:hypothetical protein
MMVDDTQLNSVQLVADFNAGPKWRFGDQRGGSTAMYRKLAGRL